MDEEVDITEEMWSYVDNSDFIEEMGIDARTSQLRDQVERLEKILKNGGEPLTAAEMNQFRMNLGSLGEVLSLLETLIDRETSTDDADPARLMTLLDLHHRLQAIVTEFGLDGRSGGEGEGRGDVENYLQFHWNHHLNPAAGFESSKKIERKADADRYGGGCRVTGGDEAEAESTECPICYVEVQVPKDPQVLGGWGKVHRLRCGHTYCQTCIYTYLKTLIMEGQVSDITCPDNECGDTLPEDEIEWICGPDLYAKYRKFVTLKELRADPDVRWCPTPGCESGVHGSAEDSKLTCPNCEHHFCWHCSLPWHEGSSCKAAQKKDRKHKGREKRGDRWVRRNTKPCPKCRIPIVKQSGCNHMTCNNCQYQFCWVCLEHFQGYQHYSEGKCKGKMYFANPFKKAAVYVGVGTAVVVALCVVVPIAVVALPIYGVYSLARR